MQLLALLHLTLISLPTLIFVFFYILVSSSQRQGPKDSALDMERTPIAS